MDARRDEILGWIVQEAGGMLLKSALAWKSVQGVRVPKAFVLIRSSGGGAVFSAE